MTELDELDDELTELDDELLELLDDELIELDEELELLSLRVSSPQLTDLCLIHANAMG